MMDEIPFWFKYPHCMTFICAIFLPIFIYQVFKGVFSSNAGSKRTLKFSFVTKYFLLAAVSFSYSYVVTTSSQTTLMWINVNKLNSFNPSLWCPLFASYRMFSYVTGRSLLYCYFIYRVNDIFNGTYLEFKKSLKYGLLSWIYCAVAIMAVSSSYVYFALESWIIRPDQNGNGSYCQSDDAAANYIKYIFLFGSFNDSGYSIITILLMVSRLFLLLTDNERKKSIGQRYRFSGENAEDEINASSPESLQRVVSMSLESPNGSDAHSGLPSGSGFDNSAFPVSDPCVENANEKGKSQKHVVVSKIDAINFHDKTYSHNKLILLISKFFIILSTVVISSQVVLFIFMLLRDYVLILYSTDTIINITCLWLSFNFSDDYYNKYFCGRCCTKCCFPFIKALALTCNQYETSYQQSHNMDACVANKCCIFCRCCCFASCRYQLCCNCCSDDITPKEIYQLAKFEIELMVGINEGKSVSDKIAHSQSQKSVMMSSVDKTKTSDD